MPSRLEKTIARFRADVLAQESQATQASLAAYQPARERLIKRIDALVTALQERDLTQTEVMQWDRARELFRQIELEVARLSGLTGKQIVDGQGRMVAMAGDNAKALALVSASGPNVATIDSTWNQLKTGDVEALVGRMADGSPLNETLARYGTEAGDAIRSALQQAVATGMNPRGTAAMLARELDIAQWKLLRIARTEQLNAYRSATLQNYRDNADIVSQWEWISAHQTRTCLACLSLDGQKFDLTVEFQPSHVSCFVAGTMVNGPKAVAGTERWYSGYIVEIETEHGRRLTVTPNHPILTTEGWVAAGSLNEQSYLICGTIGESDSIPLGVHDDDVPACIEQVARSLGSDGRVVSMRVPTTAEDFHGDGGGSEVNVVWTDGELRDCLNASNQEHLLQRGLSHRGVGNSLLSRLGSFDLGFDGLLRSSHRVMSGLRETLAFFDGSLRHSQVHAIAAPSRLYSSDLQTSPDNRARHSVGSGNGFFGLAGDIAFDHPVQIGVVERPSGRRALHAGEIDSFLPRTEQSAFPQNSLQSNRAEAWDRFADGLSAFASDVTIDRVIKFGVRAFAGHVYNLETVNGWYFANGIIAHNCRCSSIPVVKGEPDRIRPTGTQYFDSLPESDQRSMMPAIAFDDFKAGRLQLSDFRHLRHDDDWGDSYVQASAAQARANAAKRGVRFPATPAKPVTIPASTTKPIAAKPGKPAQPKPEITIPKTKTKPPATQDEFTAAGLEARAKERAKAAGKKVGPLATLDGEFSYDDKFALGDYKSFGFTANKALRAGRSTYDKEMVSQLDSLIARSRLNADTVVYRGMTGTAFGHAPVGMTIRDQGFMSTSTRRDVAEKFASESDAGVIVRILVPKGSNAVDVQSHFPTSQEDEVLLPRDTTFRVVAYRGDINPPEIDVEIVQ